MAETKTQSFERDADLLADILDRIRQGNSRIARRFTDEAYRDAFESVNVGYYRDIPDVRKELLHSFLSEKCSESASPLTNYYRDLSEILCNKGMSREITEDEKRERKSETSNSVYFTKWPRVPVHIHLSAPLVPEFQAERLSILKWTKVMDEDQPFVVRGVCNFWRGLEHWSSPQFWIAGFSDSFVPVEIGNYNSSEFEVALVSFGEYVEYLCCCPQDNNIYLAQFDIFRRFPLLENDVLPLPDFLQIARHDFTRSFFMGAPGSFTPLHTDPMPNFLVQIVGTKYVRLHSPSENYRLYQSGSMGTSSIDSDITSAGTELYRNFPLYKDSPFFEVRLDPGDMLYIPQRWWHFVKNIQTSISVSHFATPN